MENERFKMITGFNNYVISSLGVVINLTTKKAIKQSINNRGYLRFNLRRDDGKQVTRNLHRVLAICFIDNPENKPCIDHINNNKQDNNLTNLRWCTIQENNRNNILRKDSTTNVKGVSYSKRDGVYKATISIDGIRVHLGSFKTVEEATIARINKVNDAFGEFTNSCEKI